MTDDRVSFINNTIHSDFGNASYCVPHHNYVATIGGLRLITNFENYCRKDISRHTTFIQR